MASEDVIELGSSDDEAEPAPKKKKPMPNAMVHIPNKLPGVTIKPSKSNQLRKHKGVSIKPIVINKSVYNVNSNVIKNKQLGGAFQIPIKNFPKSLKTQLPVPKKCGLNPLNINKNLVRPQISIPQKTVLNPTEVKGSKLLNNLPPGITIKLVQNASGSEITKQCKMTASPNTVEVLTVELDDEELSETTATTASPQWYLRPEEPSHKKDQEEQTIEESEVADSMEEQNNKEPESTKFVEITIEDSPLKPLPPKHDSEIGKELSITIEDSPAKVIKHIPNNEGSDNEDDVKTIPHSKKKLDYPKQSERQVVEIEIDLMSTASVPADVNDDKDQPKDITTKEDKTMKHNNETANDDCRTNSAEITDQTKDNADGINIEFHPVYQNFIDTCFKLENSEDMIKIVEKKIKAYYKQCPKEYVESEEFIDMVSNKILSMKADPDKMYLYIKDIVDELNLQRKMAKSTILTITKKEDVSQDSSKEPERDDSLYHSKKRKQIRKLEKTIKKLHRAIQKLEEQEVDFDDDEDSVYVLTERYKERMVRVHKKFCQLTNAKMPSEPKIHIESRPGRPLGPARKLEKWINKKVPVGTPLPFPDFHDVLRCVRDSNDEDKLGWSEYDIMEEARDLFTRCGKKLQRRRQENEWRLAFSRISQNVDPAEKNADLTKQLNDNRALATSKEVELLNKFAEKQNQLKLEAVEIGDKEAEESPEESDEEEEEVEISNSLEDKQKRKDKLKKLLQESTKKSVENVNESKSLKETEREDAIIDNEKPEKQLNEIDKTENSELNLVRNTDSPHTLCECTEENKVPSEKIDSDEVQPEHESDTDKVESDVDELHLYQKSRKLFSPEHNATSSFGSSDSDNPIAISDTLDSDSDVETDKKLSDIISIENSSYSESESTNYKTFPNDTLKNFENLINDRLEVEYSKEENVELGENILLASSDEEDTNKVVNEEMGDTCINLKDDNISISETMVFGNIVEQDNVNNDELFSPENNIPSTNPQESPTNIEDNMIQECYEEDQNGSLKDTPLEISKGNEEINSEGSPKEIVDIGSVSDGTSIASMEMQTDIDNKVAEQIETLDQLGTQESEVNESSCDSRISEVVEPIS